MSVVWIKMMDGDTLASAQESAKRIPDPRAIHFYDPQQRAGHAIADLFGHADQVAWDMYLFFGREGEWQASLPSPLEYAHQLEDSDWADRAHLHVGDDLTRALHAAMDKINAGR